MYLPALGVNQTLFISRALNFYCLETQDKTKEIKEGENSS